jgi:uncharacterized protein YecE (DUF72 family)
MSDNDSVRAHEPHQQEEPRTEPVLPDSISVGCADLPPGLRRGRYFQRLRYLEVSGTRAQLPKVRVLRQWHEDAGERGHFGLLAPQLITDRPGPKGYPRSTARHTPEQLALAGGFRDTPVVRDAVRELAGACAACHANTVIFRSPPDFAPSTSNRDRLRAFFGDIAPAEHFGDTARVWEPLGLWQFQTAARLAEELGLVLACDPLSNDPLVQLEIDFARLPVSRVYFRITGLGRGSQRFDEYALEPLLELVAAYERVWVVFAHANRYPDAIRCQRLLADAESSDS